MCKKGLRMDAFALYKNCCFKSSWILCQKFNRKIVQIFGEKHIDIWAKCEYYRSINYWNTHTWF